MPVITRGTENFPSWCELEAFEIISLPEGYSHSFPRRERRETLIVARGHCRVTAPVDMLVAEGGKAELGNGDAQSTTQFEVREAAPGTVLVRLMGRWGAETGGAGIFQVEPSDSSEERGDLVSYPKETNFDNHYHDCDEYWIILEGQGVAASEGQLYKVEPGDCVATGMGHHHDVPLVTDPIRAVYFETTLEGRKRRGHLWDHTHGPAEPQADRV